RLLLVDDFLHLLRDGHGHLLGHRPALVDGFGDLFDDGLLTRHLARLGVGRLADVFLPRAYFLTHLRAGRRVVHLVVDRHRLPDPLAGNGHRLADGFRDRLAHRPRGGARHADRLALVPVNRCRYVLTDDAGHIAHAVSRLRSADRLQTVAVARLGH